MAELLSRRLLLPWRRLAAGEGAICAKVNLTHQLGSSTHATGPTRAGMRAPQVQTRSLRTIEVLSPCSSFELRSRASPVCPFAAAHQARRQPMRLRISVRPASRRGEPSLPRRL